MTKAKGKSEVAIAIQVDGTVYTLNAKDLRPLDIAALRKATGFSFVKLIATAQEDPDIDVVAAIVWLARRANGESNLSYEAVASDMNYDTPIELVDDPKEIETPEA